MQKILTITLTLCLGFSWTISVDQKCSCNELLLQSECTQIGCNWNSADSTCSQINCQSLDQQQCMQAPNCYFNSTACLEFTSCQNVPSVNEENCAMANCLYNGGNTCVDFQCSNFNSINCPIFCIVNGQNCEAPTSCSQFSVEQCPNNYACMTDGSICFPSTCSFYTPIACYFVETSLSLETIQPCYLGSDSTCQDADLRNLNSSQTCFSHTAGLYHWSSSNSTKGRCIPCSRKATPNYLSNSYLLGCLFTMIIIMIA